MVNKYIILVDSMVRDRVVLGINKKEVQEKLIRMENLDLNKAVEVCRLNEVAMHN